jgi:hypothetical protein
MMICVVLDVAAWTGSQILAVFRRTGMEKVLEIKCTSKQNGE